MLSLLATFSDSEGARAAVMEIVQPWQHETRPALSGPIRPELSESYPAEGPRRFELANRRMDGGFRFNT